jgi:actin-related protein
LTERPPSPVERGIIRDWAAIEDIWHQILYREMKVPFDDEDFVMITENSALTSRHDREKIAQIFFESCNVPGMFVADQAVAALYACGTVNGLVVDVGYGKTDIIPVIDGGVVRHAVESIPLGGQDIDELLFGLLRNDEPFISSYPTSTLTMKDVVKIKEQVAELCTVEVDSFEAPKEARISGDRAAFVGDSRRKCTEILFNPSINGKHILGIDDACHNVVLRCDVDKRRMLFDTILLTGRSSLIKGFHTRFQQEINKRMLISDLINETNTPDIKLIRLPNYMKNLYDHPELASWIGASLISKVGVANSSMDEE